MGKYAAGTTVEQNRTVQDLEKLLESYGATGFAYGKKGSKQLVAFEMQGRSVRFALHLPPVNDPSVIPLAQEMARAAKVAVPRAPGAAYAFIARQRWRALYLIIKAKLVAIDEGIRTFDNEFSWNVVLPGGETVGELLEPHIDRVYATGHIPPLLPGMDTRPMPELPPPSLDDYDGGDGQ